MQERWIEANGIRLHLFEHPGEGEPVILLHYGTAHARVWDGVVPHLQDRYHLVVPELRGHGHSAKPESGYTIDTMADDIDALMTELGLPSAHIVGCSLGAEVGLSLAARHPERVRSLVLEGAVQNPFGPDGEIPIPWEQVEAKKVELRAKRAARPDVSYGSRDEMFAAIRAMWEQGGHWNEHIRAALAYDIAVRPDGRYARLMPARVIDQYVEDFWDAHFDRYYERIGCPVLFLVPEGDWASPGVQPSLTRFRALLQGEHQVAILAGAEHPTGMMTHPADFAGALLAFWER